MKAQIKIVLLVAALINGSAALANPFSNVIVNGQRLTWQQLAVAEAQLGSRIAPGNYLYNAANGCWVNAATGQAGCLGGDNGAYTSRYGSGERYSNGSWIHSNGLGSVGGDSDGCLYAYDWSNC